MINRLQKMKFTLHLDPTGNKADNYASKVLRKWADDISAISKEEQSEMEMLYAADVHKQIYLSGLFLYLLSPTTSKHLSSLLIEGEVNKDNLLKSLTVGDITDVTNQNINSQSPQNNTEQTGTNHSIDIHTNPEIKELIEVVCSNSSIKDSAIFQGLESKIDEQGALIKELIQVTRAGGVALNQNSEDILTEDINQDGLNKDVLDRMEKVKKAKMKAVF